MFQIRKLRPTSLRSVNANLKHEVTTKVSAGALTIQCRTISSSSSWWSRWLNTPRGFGKYYPEGKSGGPKVGGGGKKNANPTDSKAATDGATSKATGGKGSGSGGGGSGSGGPEIPQEQVLGTTLLLALVTIPFLIYNGMEQNK